MELCNSGGRNIKCSSQQPANARTKERESCTNHAFMQSCDGAVELRLSHLQVAEMNWSHMDMKEDVHLFITANVGGNMH